MSWTPGIFGLTPAVSGVHRHRITEPLRVLANRGVNATWGPGLTDDILETHDTIVAHGLHEPWELPGWLEIRRRGTHRLVLDVDDWVWRPDWAAMRESWPPDAIEQLFVAVRAAHVVTTPTPVIAEYLARYNDNVHVVPNTVPAFVLDIERPAGPPTLGQQTSSSHRRDWTTSTARHIGRFLNTFPDWHFNLYGEIGAENPEAMPGRIHHIPWQSDPALYYASVAACTVGIGPLRDTPFNRAKSSLRAIEYAALGVVAVLPDLPPYRGWVDDGVTGLLVHPHETLYGILRALGDAGPEVWEKMSTAARERAAAWTTEAAIDNWSRAWDSR
jgi:glycosyltransferase involved in cell wall biosynthesis